jgi:hypothetical protein
VLEGLPASCCRVVIQGGAASLLIDLAVNAPPDLPASETEAGPTLAPEERAGNKLLALFDRTAADLAEEPGGSARLPTWPETIDG